MKADDKENKCISTSLNLRTKNILQMYSMSYTVLSWPVQAVVLGKICHVDYFCGQCDVTEI